MNERNYGNLVLFLSLIALALAFSPVIAVALEEFDIISKEGIIYSSLFLGFIPGLVIAIIVFKIGQHIKIESLRILAKNFSTFAIIIAGLFGVFILFGIFISPFVSR